MADFCNKCSIQMFGHDYGDLRGLVAKGLFTTVICEACGPIQVNHDGVCVSPDCKRCKPETPFVEYEKFPLNLPKELLTKLKKLGDNSFTSVNDMIVNELEALVLKLEQAEQKSIEDIEL